MSGGFYTRAEIAAAMGQFVGKRLRSRPEQAPWEASTVQNYALGSPLVLPDGEDGFLRHFRYGKLEGTTPGYRGRPYKAGDNGVERGAFLGAQTVGLKTVVWTSVGIVAADAYKDGYVLLQGGFVRKIKSNTAATAGGQIITLTLYDPIPETSAAGRYGILHRHPFKDAVTREAGPGANVPGLVIGVLPIDCAAGLYVWLQTRGPCGLISNNVDLGNADGESQLCAGVNPGTEVNVPVAHGYQTIAHVMMHDAVSWDNENFVLANLCIE